MLKIPVRTLKLDDLEEKRQEYKKLVNKYFGVDNAQIVGIQVPRRNGKSIFADYQYGPLKETKCAIATVTNYFDEKENNEMISYIRNDLDTFKATLQMNLTPLLVRSVQINEKKGVVTIVWRNGEVTMAKCGPNDEFDVEKGIAIAFMKHWFASTTQMNKWLKEQTKEYYERTFENGFEDSK